MTKLDELESGTSVTGVYTVQEVEYRHFKKKEGRWLRMVVSDETGAITAVCFDPDLIGFPLREGMRVGIKAAQVKDFKGELRLYFYPGSIAKMSDADQTPVAENSP